MIFFETVKTLFPRARAFSLFTENDKRKLIEGLSELPDEIRRDGEKVYMDLFPYSTRYPELWEKAFALFLNEYERVKRRDILDALWKIISANQAPQFIELVLKKIDPDIKVFDNTPLSDPRNKKAVGVSVCGFETMLCGHAYACCGYMMGNENYEPYILRNNIEEVYSLPDDERFWETCFFVCRELYRSGSQNILFIEPVEISITWKSLIEFLILKIKPAHTTAVLYIKFIERESDVPD